ncbi:MAG: DegT/DnrJ/EryC1/StrS family aminotransferase [Candidatus Omnitrophica bacterium]|nr:DegT/DnrJ/EryC1/StrS family aminotransferase [Candidatus Omnitrophota bacterium]
MKYPFCGPPSLGMGQILGIKEGNNVFSWFNGNVERDVVLLIHKARTGIRHACRLLGLGSGTEVLAPAYNCGSEIDALLDSGASVVLYRIDRCCKIDIEDLRSRITSKTKAIYVTHYFGFPQGMGEIRELCSIYKIYLIEDCALSLFSSDGLKKLGDCGEIAVFSLPKTLPVPDGGVLVINNPDIMQGPWHLTPPDRV